MESFSLFLIINLLHKHPPHSRSGFKHIATKCGNYVGNSFFVKLPPFLSEEVTVKLHEKKAMCLELGAGSSPCAFSLVQLHECKFSVSWRVA